MINLYLHLNCNFTDEEKTECIPVVHKMYNYAHKARREGLLAFEKICEEEPSIFLATAVEFMVDGLSIPEVEWYMETAILTGGYEGAALLERLLMAVGSSQILKGTEPDMIALLLGAMLGENYISQIMDTIRPKCKTRDEIIQKLNEMVPGKSSIPDSVKFEEYIILLNETTLQRIFREMNIYTISIALFGCSYETYKKTFENISLKNCLYIIDNLEENFRYYQGLAKTRLSGDVLECQQEFFKIMEKLEDEGEIIVMRTNGGEYRV